MGSNNPTAMIYYLCALIFYILAAFNHINDGPFSDVTWICTGTTFLCLGTIMLRRNSNKDDDDDSQDEAEK